MREIGTMKAIGIPQKGICNLYLGKIRVLTAAGCFLGFLLAFFMVSMLTGHMSRTFGNQPLTPIGCGLAVLVAVAVYGIILLFAGKVLRRMGKATVTGLLITEEGFGRRATIKDGFRRAKQLPVNLLMGLHEVRKGYGIVFGLLLLVAFLIFVPFRTVQTMEHEDFVTYMGSPVCDLLLEVEQGEDLEERNQAAANLLLAGSDQGTVAHIDALRRVRLQAVRDDGEVIGIHIDSGKAAGAGLKYLVGENPKNKTEIALSCLMAEELEKKAGDSVTILTDGGTKEFTICGIYQDVTSGGRTAKTIGAFLQEAAEKYSYGITLSPAINADVLAVSLRQQLGNGYSIENMEEFLRQTLGGVSTQVQQASYAVLLVGICLTILITALFLKLRVAREAAALAAKKAMGIPFTAILLQELYPVLLAGGFGSVCGVLLAEGFGDDLISVLFGMLGMGLKKITFAKAPAWQLLVTPALLLVALAVVTVSICAGIKHMDVAGHINE